MELDNVNIGDIVRLEIHNREKNIWVHSIIPFDFSKDYTPLESSEIIGYFTYQDAEKVKISNRNPLKSPPCWILSEPKTWILAFKTTYPTDRIIGYEVIQKANSPQD